jgi:cell wall-associated NlpC family hydrolase
MTFDPRLTPARADFAAEHLRGLLTAARFVAGTVMEVIEAQAPLRSSPSPDEPQLTEALRGELVTVYEENGEGWCWGQLAGDGYVGWLSANALRSPGPPATHRVAALRSLEFAGPSIKERPLASLSLGCRLVVDPLAEPAASPNASTGVPLVRLASGGYLPARHLAPIDSVEPDFVAVAERFVGVPYLWGGKTSLGVDCSGLVQVALTAAGIPCPRDSDMQECAFAGAPTVDMARLGRGDLVFWRGHVAIACDSETLLHANAFHMAVAFEPLTEAVHRIGATGSNVTSIRRIVAANSASQDRKPKPQGT